MTQWTRHANGNSACVTFTIETGALTVDMQSRENNRKKLSGSALEKKACKIKGVFRLLGGFQESGGAEDLTHPNGGRAGIVVKRSTGGVMNLVKKEDKKGLFYEGEGVPERFRDWDGPGSGQGEWWGPGLAGERWEENETGTGLSRYD